MNMRDANPLFTIRAADLTNLAEREAIDAYVCGHPDATPFHRPAWSMAVETGCGQRAFVLAAFAGDGTIAGVLPMTEVRSKLFGNALVSSGFAVGGGILADSNQAARHLVDTALAHARANSFQTVELRSGSFAADGWHIDDVTYHGFIRDLAADDDAELLAIPRKQRAEVRKALGFSLDVETGASHRDRDAHYHAYATSVRNLGTPVFPRKLFAAVLDLFGDDADILTIRHEREPIASVLSLYWRGTVMPFWGGGTADARRWRANDLMYYALMLHARKNKRCTRFDFGRSKAGTGPAAFKRNWGFEPVQLSYAKYALDGAAPRDINPMSAKYRMQVSIWQKLPLPVANLLGPLIARGLG